VRVSGTMDARLAIVTNVEVRLSQSNMEEMLSRLEYQLERWGTKLDTLGVANADVAHPRAETKAGARLDDLRVRVHATWVILDAAKAVGFDKWDAVKAGVESSWRELEGAFSHLAR
jgi:hypothetical protein